VGEQRFELSATILAVGCLAAGLPDLGHGAEAEVGEKVVATVADESLAAAPQVLRQGAPGAATRDLGNREPEPNPPEPKARSRWQIPPIRVWGSVAYDLRVEDAENEGRSVQNFLTTNVNAESYIWQPWFAMIAGGLGFTVSKLNNSGDGPDSRDNFVTGNARFNLFPRSRFPFEAHYEVSDSRIDSGLGAATSFRANSYGVSQRYRPVDGHYAATASYDHHTQTGLRFGKDVQDALLLDLSSSWKDNNLTANASRNRNQRESTGDETLFETLVARHNYLPSQNFSLETTANVTRSLFDLASNESESRFRQLSSVAFWRPENRPLSVTGSMRLFSLQNDGGESDVKSQAGSVGANYMFNRNTRLIGNVAVTRVQRGEVRTTPDTEPAGLTYPGEPVTFGPYHYDWFGAANLGHTGGGRESIRTESAQIGHTLNRPFVLQNGSTLSTNVGQNLTVIHTAASESDSAGVASSGVRDGTSRQLGHTASLTWSKTDAGTTAYARLSASDTRALGGDKSKFQLINFQLSGTRELDRYSSWSGDLTVQRVSQDPGEDNSILVPALTTARNRTTTTTTSADLTYRHLMAFNVPRLRFTSQLKLTQDAVTQANVLGPPQDQETKSWENRFDYLIGRLQTSLSLRVSEVDDRRRWLLLWRVMRQFGE
jgi:hypothetical protein